MSKSYRKPYSAITGVRSAHQDKTDAARAVRRTQERVLREFEGDWDEFILPDKYECPSNEVWGWSRDGNNRPMFKCQQYNNPYAYICSPTRWDEDEIRARWLSRQMREDDYFERCSRK